MSARAAAGGPGGIGGVPVLQITGLNVYYGASHALQGVDLALDEGVLSLVGRNGMGKTTLCKAIMGLVPIAGGSIRFEGREIAGLRPAEVARLGIGYVPQGRRLWRSLSVDEHLRMVDGGNDRRARAWTPERVYATFPRLAERRDNGGGQLSGGEQQMLAIARALLLNPRLLLMDEPTEGLAPLIVHQVQEMLIGLAEAGEVDVLVIEQNIGVATSVSEEVAVMVNGRVDRLVPAGQLAADRALQQRLLGVGRLADDDPDGQGDRSRTEGRSRRSGRSGEEADDGAARPAARQPGGDLVYLSNPETPTRWSPPVPPKLIERSARTRTSVAAGAGTGALPATHGAPLPLVAGGRPVVIVAGTLDTKGVELRFLRDMLAAHDLPVQLVDLSTSGEHSGADVPPHQVAAFHPRGSSGVFGRDRGESIAAMTLAFERWIRAQGQVLGIVGAGGSGGTALVAPAMRALPFGVPKLIVSTVASGDTSRYVGAADITMMHSVADVQGLNSITREVLANAAHALGGMVSGRRGAAAAGRGAPSAAPPAVGLTMFGVTTPCVRQLVAALDKRFECLVFHATGIGGRSMESLIDDGRLAAVLDVTTTEVCDLLAGGVFPATEDRFGAVIRRRLPYLGACGALDMVNFGAPETVPERYRGRLLHAHNPQVTLMRTTPEENAAIGRWIGERLNLMDGPVRFFLPEGGVSALDAPGQPFHDPAANGALFAALRATVRETAQRRLVHSPHHVNEAAFVAEVLEAFGALHGMHGRASGVRRRAS